MPQALVAFFSSQDFEDAIRNAISIGGDSDTIAAIAGSIAEAYYGIPQALRDAAMQRLPASLQRRCDGFTSEVYRLKKPVPSGCHKAVHGMGFLPSQAFVFH